jgi:hypothetical protein
MFKTKGDITGSVMFLCNILNIPKDQICLGGGGALMLMDIRQSTADLNVWVDSPHFERIAEMQKVTNHAMTDTVVPYEFGLTAMESHGHVEHIPSLNGPIKVTAYIRERNRYFKDVEVGEGLFIFDTLTLSIHKHGGAVEPRRPLAKRQQDHRDIVFLNAILAEKNKVKDVA